MTDWEDEILSGADAPRPLAPELRRRLEQSLTEDEDEEGLALDEELSSRLADALVDPLVAELSGIDVPRPVTDSTRERLQAALLQGRRRRRLELTGAVAAGLVLVAGAVAGLLATGALNAAPHGSRPEAIPALPTTTGLRASSAGAAVSGSSSPRAQSAGTPAAAQAGPAGLVPVVDGIDPVSGPETGGTWVVVTGSNLDGARAVTFGGRGAVTFVVVSASEIRAESPPHAPGQVDVQVVGRATTSAASEADHFEYLEPGRAS